MDSEIIPISASSSADQVIITFQNLDLISLPVVDKKNRLLGEITVDDVVDIIQDQANSEIFNMAGLDDEDDIFAPILVSSKRRAVWLGANLFTAFVVASAVSLFQSTIDQIVILAVLMPIVNVWRSNRYSTSFLRGQDSVSMTRDSWSLQIKIFPHI